MGQLHLAVDVADGVHAGYIGAAEAIHLHKALPVHFHADGVQANAPGIGGSAAGHQHHVALHSALGAVLDRGVVDLQAVLDRLHLHTQHQLHTAGL